HLEAGAAAEPGCRAQAAVEGVLPAVVGARDPLAGRRLPGLQQLVPAVAADVEEGARRPVRVPEQEGGLGAGLDGPPVAGLGQVRRPADADPGALEEMAH